MSSGNYSKKPTVDHSNRFKPKNCRSIQPSYRAGVPSSCDCRQTTPKQFWYNTNRNIIMSLGRVLGLHGDTVCDFLYSLTMQNFGKILNPRGHSWKGYNVPLCNFDTCDYYMGAFDCNGNLRNPYHPKSLLKLLSVMQRVLKESKDPDKFSVRNLFEGRAKSEKTGKPSEEHKFRLTRTGLEPDSIARENGRRRLLKAQETYRLDGLPAAFGPLAGKCGLCEKAGKPCTSPYTASQAAKGFCKGLWPEMVDKNGDSFTQDGEPNDISGLNLDKFYGVNGGSQETGMQRQSLKNLIRHVQDTMGLYGDPDKIALAIRDLDLKKARQSEAQIAKQLTKRISHDYNTMARTGQLLNIHGKTLKGSSIDENDERNPINQENQRIEGVFYYGEQVPILMHKPFNPKDPTTWIRRHPQASRMGDTGSIIEEGVIRRYKRQSVVKQFEKARERMSVRTVYSVHSNDSSTIDPGPKPKHTKKKLVKH